jgi:hypothetical protein
MVNVVTEQNELLQKQIDPLKNEAIRAERNADYKAQTYASIQFVNNVLVYIYFLLFTVIHLLFLELYVRGIKDLHENWMKDTLIFMALVCYPYFIYTIESYIYRLIMYVWSFITGRVYIYRFDRMFGGTDFYKNPDPSVESNGSDNSIDTILAN